MSDETETEETFTVGKAIDSLGFGWFQIALTFAVGLSSVGDAMEMMILSILSPALHCHWHISQVEQASLTTIVFLGMMIGSPLWGKMSDVVGRKPTVLWSTIFLCYFGFLTAFSPSFYWVLFIRFLVGVFIGGVPQSCVLYAEYVPSKDRGKSILMLSFFWALGSVFEAILAYLIMPNYGNNGWRILVVCSSLPLGLLIFLSCLLPESPMFLAACGKKDEVEKQLKQIASMNGKPNLLGSLSLNSGVTSRGSFSDLLSRENIRTTLLLWFLWFVSACSYYGSILLSTEMLNSNSLVCSSDKLPSTLSGGECSIRECQGLRSDDYVSLIWTSLSEFPSTLFSIFLIDTLGRKRTLAIQSFLFALSTFLVFICSLNRHFLTFLLFLSRGLSSGLLQTVYVYTSEVYSTENRALALGSGSSVARLGAMLTPFIATVLLRASPLAACSVYALLGTLAGIFSLCLTFETTGKDLTSRKSNLLQENESKF